MVRRSMSGDLSWSTRGAVPPLMLSAGGFLALSLVPWIFAPAWTVPRVLTSFALGGSAALLVFREWPRALRSSLALRNGSVEWSAGGRERARLVSLEAAPSEVVPSGRHARFGVFGTTAAGRRVRLHEADDPAVLWEFLKRAGELLPWSLKWGTGNLLRSSDGPPAFARVVGHPWPALGKVRRILALLAALLAAAWLVILSRSLSPVGATSMGLALASWLFLVMIAALCVLDAVEVQVGPTLVIRRKRLGIAVLDVSFPWETLEHLELVEDERGFGYLLAVGEKALSLPLAPEARRALARALELGQQAA